MLLSGSEEIIYPVQLHRKIQCVGAWSTLCTKRILIQTIQILFPHVPDINRGALFKVGWYEVLIHSQNITHSMPVKPQLHGS